MKASRKYLAIVAVAVLALAVLCINGCKKSDETTAKSGIATPASIQK